MFSTVIIGFTCKASRQEPNSHHTALRNEYCFTKKQIDKEERGMEGTLASWLMHLSPDQTVQVCALAMDIVLCSLARHFTLTVLLSTISTQVYKWVPANLMLEGTLRWTRISSGESENTSKCFILQKPG